MTERSGTRKRFVPLAVLAVPLATGACKFLALPPVVFVERGLADPILAGRKRWLEQAREQFLRMALNM